jgi:hypothetical protein
MYGNRRGTPKACALKVTVLFPKERSTYGKETFREDQHHAQCLSLEVISRRWKPTESLGSFIFLLRETATVRLNMPAVSRGF